MGYLSLNRTLILYALLPRLRVNFRGGGRKSVRARGGGYTHGNRVFRTADAVYIKSQ